MYILDTHILHKYVCLYVPAYILSLVRRYFEEQRHYLKQVGKSANS
jgi:hypothetical protein